MSSEPIERRVSYIGDRLRGCRCTNCGREYFGFRDYCGDCGRASMGKMQDIDFLHEEAVLESCTIVREPTNRFMKLAPFIFGIFSFHNGKVRVPGRVTDLILKDGADATTFEGRRAIPRFRRRCSVGESDIIQTISLAFSMSDDYYPYQPYEKTTPGKEHQAPGIVGWGAYTSKFRIREGRMERSVPFLDEDATTAAVESVKLALVQSGVDGSSMQKIYAGSESNPYAVKPLASKVAQVLELGRKEPGGLQGIDAIDTQFACKPATSMFKDATSLVHYLSPRSETPQYAVVVGTDNSQAAPRGTLGGELDFFVGYGGVSFIFGTHDVAAEIEDWYSCTSDTPDFWRRDTQRFPRHGGRFTGEPAYFKHIEKAARGLMEKMHMTAADYAYFVPHQPNVGFPVRVAKKLGFKEEQVLPGLAVAKFGNLYSGSSPIGLAAVLDKAKPDERIMLVGYGSGAGSDAYSFMTTQDILTKRGRQKFTVEKQMNSERLEYVDYHTYRRFKAGL
jgi:hydroxymethylglutaryl-CoA synthase